MSNSYLLTKLQNQLTKNGHNFLKSASNALKIEVFKKCATKVNFYNEIFFLKTSIFKAFKALFTKIVPLFCQLILEFW
jgi:phosphopantetheinyl transferase (holo-ACP synthase)